MDYLYVVKRAGQIAWRHKALWLFGVLAVLRVRLLGPFLNTWVELGATVHVAYFVLLALLGATVSLGLLVLNAAGQSALVGMVYQIENGVSPDMRGGWALARRRAWPVLALFLLELPPLVVSGLGVVPIALVRVLRPADGTEVVDVLAVMVSGLTCLTPALCLSALLWLPLAVLRRLAVQACVLEERTVVASVVRGWQVARDNLGAVIVLGLILAIVAIAAITFASAPLTVLVAAVLAARRLLELPGPAGPLLLTLATGALLWLFGVALNGLIESLCSAYWTLAYRQLAGLGRTGDEPEWAVGKTSS